MESKLVNPNEFGLDENQAVIVEQEFLPVITEREALSSIYSEILTKEITIDTVKEARELRLKLVKVRTNTDKIHKTQKAFYLAGGKFVDAWKNKNNTIVEQMESKLLEIENYFVNLEREKLEKLKAERIELLATVCDDTSMYVVESMSEVAFNTLINGLKLAKEAELKAIEDAKIEAERIRVENERIEAERKEKERIENEKIRLENERLQAEAKAKELEAKKEREKLEAKLKEQKAKAEAERKEAERIAKIEAEKQAEILRIEREKQEQLRKELEAKAEAERKEAERIAVEEKRKQEEIKKAALAPDKNKLIELGNAFSSVRFPTLSNQEAEAILNNIKSLQIKLVNYINEQANKL